MINPPPKKNNCLFAFFLPSPLFWNTVSGGVPRMTFMINQTDVILDNTKLERVKKNKFLGVIIDEQLTLKSHIDRIRKTISMNIGMINRLNVLFLNEFCEHYSVL